MWATTNTTESLNNMPLWMLSAFCKEWRVAVTIEDGKITEIINSQEEPTMLSLTDTYNRLPIVDVIDLCKEHNESLIIKDGKIANIVSNDEEDYNE